VRQTAGKERNEDEEAEYWLGEIQDVSRLTVVPITASSPD
jgi:hypothetical protein